VSGLSPKLPLNIDEINGYALNQNFKEVARQNLKMVILTSPGERIMIPEFGVGIRNYLFENVNTSTFNTIRQRIINQVASYLPYITIRNIEFTSERNDGISGVEPSSNSNYVNIQIRYSVPSMFISDTLILQI
jgi:phage baseplate assembly protein W|tara:strand:- start:41 stop:439 length:399 start_codon:yes stop_codon:yes gene_type:complete